MTPSISDNAVVLFQGDSITDAGRFDSADGMGFGYANLAAAWFSALYPEKGVRFINRGISGNRVVDLARRWQPDCLDLKPDWVSILIGINDTWRRYDSNDPTTTEKYETGYRALLRQTTEQLPGVRLILCEPFVLPVPADRAAWREDLDPKIAAARRLAREFNALYVPLDGLFAQAATQAEPAFWAEDGVHPTLSGHALMAQAWLRAVKAI
ncbi:MAG: GDSL family lipase [Chloroflexi bacterium]|nr:GDSL family lipase [Chloroflexota bacterium]